ncbi:MAG: CPBP family intramembrane metalloprotease [Gemmatimonadota bacterium]|nr:CPBP family intramembrane metalloprotease [Gemmatimonadota bacterium]
MTTPVSAPASPARTRLLVGVVAATALVAVATAAWLFPRSLPIVSLGQQVTREIALSRADTFFRAHALAPSDARSVVHFEGNDSLRTFVELAGGGADSLNALVRGRDVAPFFWSVRAFVPRNPREARVDFAPDGRIIGFSRTLAESDPRPTIAADSGERLATSVLGTWVGERPDRWKLVTSSYETRKTSARVDRTYTFERTDRRIGGAGIRAEVVIRGDLPSRLRQYVDVPESFRRRYSEMRSANDLLALIAGLGALAIAIAGIVFVSRTSRENAIRWREASFVGGVIGVLTIAAGLNEMGGSWFEYDTAMSPTAFQARIAIGAVVAGVFTGLLAAVTLAAAEAATRKAFPRQLDWWKLWRYRGTREVAARVGGGYAVATIGFAYVAVFYLVTRNVLGWWVPSEVLDDPNLIATPIPWMSGIAVSLNAGVWEETLFRALPLALLSLWVGPRPRRRWWMAAGVVATALTFGFAHANYASWPPYSRGVEIFFDACFWAVLVLTFGVLVTVIAHFVYDLVLFGLFATSGTALEYRISAAIIVLALLAPALAVVGKWIRQRGLAATPDDARFGAWTPGVDEKEIVTPVPLETRIIGGRSRKLAVAALIAAVLTAVGMPSTPTLGPPFTANRNEVIRTADSLLRASGGDPAGWRRLTTTARDTLDAWPRFLREYKLVPRAQRFAATYVPPTWWTVRYVHTSGSAAQRNEEWRVRVLPNGRPLDARHLIPDSAQRPSAPPQEVRRLALDALARTGVNTATLQEIEYRERALPARRDVTVTYTDTAVKLPAGAGARASVNVAGNEPLVARRGVELPESFLRADRDRQTNNSLVAGSSALLVLGFILVGAIIVTRKRPILVDDGTLGRRQAAWFLAALIVLSILSSLNALPSSLFSYDTTEPWSRFTGTRALGFVTAIPLSLFIYGLCVETNALRQRVGIPLMPRVALGTAVRDMLAAGLGLAGLVFAASRLAELASKREMPRLPSTSLNEIIPVLGGVVGLPIATLIGVAVVAIPLLVIGGLTRRWLFRVLLAVAVIAPGVIGAFAVAPTRETSPALVAVVVVAMVAIVIALLAWGSVSALSWLVAALATQALSALHGVTHSATTESRVESLLVVIVASVLIVLVARYAPQDDVADGESLRVGSAANLEQGVAIVPHSDEWFPG